MTQPDAHELLDIARSTLLEQLLPALPGELRYPALMIANAMAIAARESRLGGSGRGPGADTSGRLGRRGARSLARPAPPTGTGHSPGQP